MMKPLLLVSKPKAWTLKRGLSCCGPVVSLYHQESLNFQRLLARFNRWILLGLKQSLTIFQTSWEQHQRVTQPAKKWETSGCEWLCPYLAFRLPFQNHKLNQVTPFLLLRSFYSCSFTAKSVGSLQCLLSLTLHLFPFLHSSHGTLKMPHSPISLCFTYGWVYVAQPPGKSSVILEVKLKLHPSPLWSFPWP